MAEAIIFSDAHVSEGGLQGAASLERFLAEVCPSARRVFILGDLFDFWFGPKQAKFAPYKGVLEAIGALGAAGTEVTFYHGNRDFYIGEELARRFSFKLVRDYSIEEICGGKVLLCHGDMLCTNDVRYHRMRAFLRHPVTERLLRHLPSFLARAAARLFRAHSRRAVAAKPQWVLGINDDAVAEHFALGADTIVCGHTHIEGKGVYQTPRGPCELYRLGAFGGDGSYIECDDGPDGLRFLHWA
ncbi:MAG: UDP-2,3-diacylglucosamine diphosphatase [Planctomycetes bacterium]|nr:UDP-2,3-diacylglucosamine diphosphatase [Planctomycetota bacterium]